MDLDENYKLLLCCTCMPQGSSQAVVPELWHKIIAKSFFAKSCDDQLLSNGQKYVCLRSQ